jgi:hypothetical protein
VQFTDGIGRGKADFQAYSPTESDSPPPAFFSL